MRSAYSRNTPGHDLRALWDELPNLTDDADAIAQKIKKARTDPEPLPGAVEALDARPEAKNSDVFCPARFAKNSAGRKQTRMEPMMMIQSSV